MRIRTLTLALLAFIPALASADWITEFGGGYKLPETTSVVLKPECQSVTLTGDIVTDPSSPHFGRRRASCGGDNPVFIGWPIAWQKELKREVWTVRVGWFHMSHWFDGGNIFKGGDRHETHFDCLCATVTLNWSKAGLRSRR